MDTIEIRKKFYQFFEERGHKIMRPASLLPTEADSSVLFTTAGMQQFKKFYQNPKEAPAPRVVTIQPCVRTSDIDEVGDESHLTFFEMMGNFSFGYPDKKDSYFKKEAIELAWEFLTDKKWLGIESARISATHFGGDKNLPSDKESLGVLKKLDGLEKITSAVFEDNFWSLGVEGSPGGPTVEFYIDDMEVWNLVFNEYVFENGKYKPSKYKGVDTGMGLERLVSVLADKKSIFANELYSPVTKKLEALAEMDHSKNRPTFRIINDHLKATVFILAEDVTPSNKLQGYILRRLIRRAIVKAQSLRIAENFTKNLVKTIIEIYKNDYPALFKRQTRIENELDKEEKKFRQTINQGLRMFERRIGGFGAAAFGRSAFGAGGEKKKLTGKDLFDLYQTYGFPLELSMELAKEKKTPVAEKAEEEFKKEFEKHQELSRQGLDRQFKGGLADQSKETVHLHTAAHLLHAALRKVLGTHVLQKGSNINPERLRFDFSHPEKMSEEQIKKVENLVNEQIKKNLPVKMEEISLNEAKKSGALGVFDERYGEKVKVYTIDDPSTSSGSREKYFSREICGGPHAKSTNELGHFKITNEQSSSAGVRRIKAVLE